MTNNTINVPRELLEVIEQTWRIHYQGGPVTNDIAADAIEKGLGQLRTLLSAPSPAGVDGLNTDRNSAFKACPESGCDWGSFYLGWKARGEVEQAILDGLRGENERIRLNIAEYNEAIACYQSERDQQAQRIGELERALLEVAASLAWNAHGECRAIHDGPIMSSKMALDAAKAALSAGKEGE